MLELRSVEFVRSLLLREDSVNELLNAHKAIKDFAYKTFNKELAEEGANKIATIYVPIYYAYDDEGVLSLRPWCAVDVDEKGFPLEKGLSIKLESGKIINKVFPDINEMWRRDREIGDLHYQISLLLGIPEYTTTNKGCEREYVDFPTDGVYEIPLDCESILEVYNSENYTLAYKGTPVTTVTDVFNSESML